MITLKLKNKSFRILRDGKSVFSLTEGARIAEVANIDADYTMSRGSFVLKERSSAAVRCSWWIWCSRTTACCWFWMRAS